ncbi:hypothetical protein BUPH_04064 [Paraburkholderia phenoliruptrix BR3459a]|uniref:Uncharacterized protein n=1 Tax=Paraburkholderia phenoliruptrix BR3459a TaxID=1229205 RepID=K0DHW3_9BURK|nr:hypothetical protein BUPH_04064 [Paraburkholderia phenoliruptrix BR3459a]
MAVRKGKLAQTIVVVRLIVEPIWAGPSLRTIFINKNMAGYCGYISPISFVAYRPAKRPCQARGRGTAASAPARAKQRRHASAGQ